MKVENLVRNYKMVYSNRQDEEEIKVLKGLDFTIEEQEFVGIMGKSGCGKTTLLKILGFMDQQTDGDVIFDGANTNELWKEELTDIRRRKIGFVFQDFNLMDSLSVKENIMLPVLLDKKEQKECEEKAEALEKQFGIKHLQEKNPYELSGGERQRVAICRALINDPGVVEDVMEKAGEVFDPSEFTHVEAMMLGEDFANYLEEMDGCFAFIGGGDHPANHHGKFDFDEKALISGVRLMLTFVIV